MQDPVPRVGHFSSVPWIPNYVGSDAWPVSLVKCESSGVRSLATGAQLDATPMAVADWFELESSWKRLGDWGISFREKADSVCLFSPRPIDELHLAEIAICDQTTTSVRILQALLKDRYQLGIGRWRRHVDATETDTPRLLIQNEAVEERRRKRFPYVYDLGAEWFAWQGTPIITALWVHKGCMEKASIAMMQQLLSESMARYRADPAHAIAAHRRQFKWSASVEEIAALHGNFSYELQGSEFQHALERMREILPKHLDGFNSRTHLTIG